MELSALLESDDEKILFDTGFNENTVLAIKSLGKDLVKSRKYSGHFLGDHTGGLIKLRKTVKKLIQRLFLLFMLQMVFLSKDMMKMEN